MYQLKLVLFSALAMLSLACSQVEGQKNTAPQNLSVEQAQVLIGDVDQLIVLDVRTPAEYQAGHIKDAKNVDYRSEAFKQWLGTADKTAPYLVHCKSGGRSSRAITLMEEAGFTRIHHLERGFDAWLAADAPSVSENP